MLIGAFVLNNITDILGVAWLLTIVAKATLRFTGNKKYSVLRWFW